MARICNIAIVFAILMSTFTLSLAFENSTFAIKDSMTIISMWSGNCLDCPNHNCDKCRFGKDPYLSIFTSRRVILRALVGFILPDGAMKSSSEITACSIQFPPFTRTTPYSAKIGVFLANSSDWGEETVSNETAPGIDIEDPLVEIEMPPYESLGPIDVTAACKKAQNSTDGQFSIILATDIGRYEMGSKESGNPAVLHVTYQ